MATAARGRKLIVEQLWETRDPREKTKPAPVPEVCGGGGVGRTCYPMGSGADAVTLRRCPNLM